VIFDRTGEVRDGLYVLGSAAVPIYLLDGPCPVIFDGGLTCLGDTYVKAVREVLGGRTPFCLFLTHVHFDHCGAVSRLLREYPGMKVAGSARARQVLARPNAVRLIRELNDDPSAAVHGLDPRILSSESFEPFDVDWILEPDSRVVLEGGVEVHALATPGHTWDFFSFHVPAMDLLVASEAAGVMHPVGYVMCECLVDFEAYMTSLRRLAQLESRVLCQAHHFVFTDAHVEDFLRRGTRTSMEFQALVERLFRETGGDRGETLERIQALEYDPLPLPRQPEHAYRINLAARIRSVLGIKNSG